MIKPYRYRWFGYRGNFANIGPNASYIWPTIISRSNYPKQPYLFGSFWQIALIRAERQRCYLMISWGKRLVERLIQAGHHRIALLRLPETFVARALAMIRCVAPNFQNIRIECRTSIIVIQYMAGTCACAGCNRGVGTIVLHK